MKNRRTTQKPGALAKRDSVPAAKRKGTGGKPMRHPSRAAATKRPTPEHNPPVEEEEEGQEVDEEDRVFVEEHSAFAASLLSLSSEGSHEKHKGKKKDSMPAPPKPPAPMSAKKNNQNSHLKDEDDEVGKGFFIETKTMRRNASTEGWDTARGKGNKVIKERLPTKTIDGAIHFCTEEVEEKEEKDIVVAEMEVVGPKQGEPQPEDKEDDEDEDEDEDEEDYDDGSVASSDASESEAISQHLRNAKGKGDDKDNLLSSGRLAAVASSLSLEAFGGDMRALRRARLELKKVEIATLCEAMLEHPETGLLTRSGNGGGGGKGSRMAALLSLLEDDDVKVQALAMASLLAVFRDLAPAYRIRLPTEKELQVKASKEVKQTREYERTFLSSYQAYLKHLEKASKKQTIASGKKTAAQGNLSTPNNVIDVSSSVAAKCLCELLTALAHFNFTTNVLTAVIRLGLGPDAATRVMAGQAVRRLLERDQQGDVSLTATKLVCREVQNRQLHAPDDMVRALQALKLRVKEDEAEEVLRKAKMEVKKKKSKHSKETAEEAEEEGRGDIMAGLKEAEARADPALRARCQAESLQEVTLLYFRVLKQAKKPTLLPAALEGLSRVAHLINLDTVIDVLDVLKDLLDPSRHLPLEASLHAVLTALRTLQGPGRELKVDDKAFLTFLYQQLGRMGMDGAVSGISSGGSASSNSNRAAVFPLLITCLRSALLARREFSLARVAAFYKRLTGLALQLNSPNEARVVLGLIKELPTRYPGLEQLLDGEADRVAMGVYQPEALEPEMSNPLASGAWELSLLKSHHYHHAVRKAGAAAVVAAQAAGAAHQTATPWSSSSFRIRSHFTNTHKYGEVNMEEDWDFLKHGFGGMFSHMPRFNPLHGMVRRAERERRGQRVKLYFVQKFSNPEVMEGGVNVHKARLLQGTVAGRKEGKEGEEGGEVSFRTFFRETRSHTRKLFLCRKLQRSRALLKRYELHRAVGAGAGKK